MRTFLGFDTSNYKTSCALVSENGEIIKDEREFLEVRKGERGLRQQEAFFQHIQKLPVIIGRVFDGLYPDLKRGISAVSASARPRPEEGSYMPVFTAGVSAARIISRVLDVPYYEFSHQEGHIASCARVAVPENVTRFLAFHLSGGTTEGLLVNRTCGGFRIERINGTSDISFGQLIDRTGVSAGYPFPAGEYIDRAALSFTGEVNPLPALRLRDGSLNLSGIETRAERRIHEGESPEMISAAVMDSVCQGVKLLINDAAVKTGAGYALLTGGVSASEYLRKKLTAGGNVRILYGSPSLSSDNAVGTAILGGKAYAAETGQCNDAEQLHSENGHS